LIAVPVPAPVAIIVFFILILMTAPLALFPADRTVPEHAQAHGVQVRLDAPRPNWVENYCTESPTMIAIGKESYFLTGDRQLMPVRKDQPPLRRKFALRAGRLDASGLRAKCTGADNWTATRIKTSQRPWRDRRRPSRRDRPNRPAPARHWEFSAALDPDRPTRKPQERVFEGLP